MCLLLHQYQIKHEHTWKSSIAPIFFLSLFILIFSLSCFVLNFPLSFSQFLPRCRQTREFFNIYHQRLSSHPRFLYFTFQGLTSTIDGQTGQRMVIVIGFVMSKVYGSLRGITNKNRSTLNQMTSNEELYITFIVNSTL